MGIRTLETINKLARSWRMPKIGEAELASEGKILLREAHVENRESCCRELKSERR